MTAVKTRFGIALLVVIVVGVPFGANRVNERIRDSYAVSWVASMVIEHLKANDGRWPGSWDDLRDDYQSCVKRLGEPWSFAELSSRVVVDWDADPQQLLSQSNTTEAAGFNVIRLADGADSHWQSREPNDMILRYLRSNPSVQ
jgi:hypothetical protein